MRDVTRERTIMLPSTVRAAYAKRSALQYCSRSVCRALSPRRKRNLVAVVLSELSFFALAWRNSLSLSLMSLMLRVAGPSVDQASANPAADNETLTTLQVLPRTSHRAPDPPPSAAPPPWHLRQRFRTPLLLP